MGTSQRLWTGKESKLDEHRVLWGEENILELKVLDVHDENIKCHWVVQLQMAHSHYVHFILAEKILVLAPPFPMLPGIHFLFQKKKLRDTILHGT